MFSRALIPATVMLFVAWLAPTAHAQNLEAGKSPSQLFSATCSVCHKSARGLLNTVPPSGLTGFLRQHYTTSSSMAQALSGYVIANGAAEGRGRERTTTRQGRERTIVEQPAAPAEAAKPKRSRAAPVEATAPQEDKPRTRRRGRAEPGPELLGDAARAPVAEEEKAPAKPKTSKRRQRQQEKQDAVQPQAAPAVDAAKPAEPRPAETKPADVSPAAEPKASESKPADAKPAEAKSEAAKSEPVKSEPVNSGSETRPLDSKPADSQSGEGKSDGKTPEPAAPPPTPAATRADPVPAVTPAATETTQTTPKPGRRRRRRRPSQRLQRPSRKRRRLRQEGLPAKRRTILRVGRPLTRSDCLSGWIG